MSKTKQIRKDQNAKLIIRNEVARDTTGHTESIAELELRKPFIRVASIIHVNNSLRQLMCRVK